MSYADEIKAWRQARLSRLTSENGWLSLVDRSTKCWSSCMITGSILVYRCVGTKPTEIIAVAPLAMRYRVELACAARNVEAKEAGYDTVYKYDVVGSIKMFQEGDHVTL